MEGVYYGVSGLTINWCYHGVSNISTSLSEHVAAMVGGGASGGEIINNIQS